MQLGLIKAMILIMMQHKHDQGSIKGQTAAKWKQLKCHQVSVTTANESRGDAALATVTRR